MDRLKVRDADKRRDGHALLGFRCWTGDENEPWIREVEEYVRCLALATAYRVLLFETELGDVAGVSAFDRQDISPAGRRRVAGWRLQVVALGLPWQGKLVEADIEGSAPTMKASEYLLRATFRRMLEIDSRRVIVVARVHDDNRASMIACARVGLDRTSRESDEYWAMIGEVDPTARATSAGGN